MTEGRDAPTFVGELELADASEIRTVGPRAASHYPHARILVRLHGEPMGFVEMAVPSEGLDAASAVQAAWRSLRPRISAHLSADGVDASASLLSTDLGDESTCRALPATYQQMPISVVVCTRNRPDLLTRALRSLERLRYAHFEVVLVDNAPDDDRTLHRFETVASADDRFRYVREPTPGLSRARNRGAAEARFGHVAFTDDDAMPDPLWLEAIARGFGRAPGVGCVTGLVPAALLDSSAERYFDRRVSWAARLDARVFDIDAADSLPRFFPFDAGVFGTGANFAVERDALLDLGGFDESLGAGSPTRGSEDLDLFVRMLRSGRKLAYEPAAIVWHLHRATESELRDQMRDYGIALGAYLTKSLRDRESRRLFVRYFARGAKYLVRSWRDAGAGVPGGSSFAMTEVWGVLLGPATYIRANRARRRAARTT